jgi:uncharacterized protein YutE (UPF0331/DUF86 family)
MSISIDKIFIENKLKALTHYTRELEDVLAFEHDSIRKDYLKLHALERLVQLVVDEMVDINTHIIRRGAFSAPDDFQSSFKILAEGGVFPREFAERIAPTVGLRNRLVHRYEEIDPELLIRTAKAESGDFREYIAQVNAYLKNAQ